jgi:K+-sensing histidine kinase KdpD
MHGRDQTDSKKKRMGPRKIVRSLLRAVPACVVVGLITFIGYGLRLNFPTVSFCFLIVVVLQSLIGDFLSSALVSLLSFLCLNYFFVPPIFSLRVSDSSDTLALVAFLVAGLVITRLTSETRKAAASEESQRREMSRLYELAQQLLQLKPEATIGTRLLEPFKAQFGVRAVCMFDAATAEDHWSISQKPLARHTSAGALFRIALPAWRCDSCRPEAAPSAPSASKAFETLNWLDP